MLPHERPGSVSDSRQPLRSLGRAGPARPIGLALGTTVTGLVGLVSIWVGGFGCIDAVRTHLGGDFEPGVPAVQLILSSGVIGFGLCFLCVSYGLDRGRGWSRHLILAGCLLLLAAIAFGPLGPLAPLTSGPSLFQRRLVLGAAAATLFVTGYLYVKPNVVAYYRRSERTPFR